MPHSFPTRLSSDLKSDEDDQRMIEALPLHIIHIVEHPEEVPGPPRIAAHHQKARGVGRDIGAAILGIGEVYPPHRAFMVARFESRFGQQARLPDRRLVDHRRDIAGEALVDRSEEHTSELQSLMRISYAVFCLKKKI